MIDCDSEITFPAVRHKEVNLEQEHLHIAKSASHRMVRQTCHLNGKECGVHHVYAEGLSLLLL